MIKLLVKVSNWKFIIPFFLFTAVMLFLFVKGQNEMSVIAGEEVTLIDLFESYNLKEISAYFENIKPDGRTIHQQLTSVNDMIFPFAYGPFFILILAFLLKKLFGKNSKCLLLSLFPIITMGIDYLENLNTLEMLNNFPNLTEQMVNTGSFLTEMKNLSSQITNILIAILSIALIVKMANNMKMKKDNNS